jgi:hypothetical protein
VNSDGAADVPMAGDASLRFRRENQRVGLPAISHLPEISVTEIGSDSNCAN